MYTEKNGYSRYIYIRLSSEVPIWALRFRVLTSALDLNYFQYVPRRSETSFGELRSSAVRIRGVLWVVYEEEKKLSHAKWGVQFHPKTLMPW